MLKKKMKKKKKEERNAKKTSLLGLANYYTRFSWQCNWFDKLLSTYDPGLACCLDTTFKCTML